MFAPPVLAAALEAGIASRNDVKLVKNATHGLVFDSLKGWIKPAAEVASSPDGIAVADARLSGKSSVSASHCTPPVFSRAS